MDLISPQPADESGPFQGRLVDKVRRLTGIQIERERSVSRPLLEEGEYDLFFVVGTNPQEIARLGLQRWVEEAAKRCRKTVCCFE